jgi:hypothetical protein
MTLLQNAGRVWNLSSDGGVDFDVGRLGSNAMWTCRQITFFLAVRCFGMLLRKVGMYSYPMVGRDISKLYHSILNNESVEI